MCALFDINNMPISAIECEVVPGPIGHRADLVATTDEIEEVKPEPGIPRDRSA